MNDASVTTGPAWVCIPTYNERENVHGLVAAVRSSLDSAGIDGHVLVIDDGSPDGTGAIADLMAESDARVHVLHRPGKGGIGPAYIAGSSTHLRRAPGSSSRWTATSPTTLLPFLASLRLRVMLIW